MLNENNNNDNGGYLSYLIKWKIFEKLWWL